MVKRGTISAILVWIAGPVGSSHTVPDPGAVPLPASGRGRALFVGTFHLVLCLAQSGHRLSGCLLTRHGPLTFPENSRAGPCAFTCSPFFEAD